MFADTYEVYLRVLRIVDDRVRSALGWDGENWRVLNACRACCYKVRLFGATALLVGSEDTALARGRASPRVFASIRNGW